MSRKNAVPLVTISLDEDEGDGGGELEQAESTMYQQYVYTASEAPLGMYAARHSPELYNPPPTYAPLPLPSDPPVKRLSTPPQANKASLSQTPPRALKSTTKPAMTKAISAPNVRKPAPKQPVKTNPNTSNTPNKTPSKPKAGSSTNLRSNPRVSNGGTPPSHPSDTQLYTHSNYNNSPNHNSSYNYPNYNYPDYNNSNLQQQDDDQPISQQHVNSKVQSTRGVSPGKRQANPTPR
jgi:hypothetical protein